MNRNIIHTILLLSLALQACNFAAVEPTPAASNLTENDTYPTDKKFLDLYDNVLGEIETSTGEHLLGPAISVLLTEGDLQVQYFVNGKLFYRQTPSAEARYGLAPVGSQLGYFDTPNLMTVGPGDFEVEGFIIHPAFFSLYQQLGAGITGAPLTYARYNDTHHRIEQFFENVAFYINLDSGDGQVHLLPYGVYACDAACRYMPTEFINGDQVAEPFFSLHEALGYIFAGDYVAGPHTGADGQQEVVFDHMVMFAVGEQVFVRPIVSLLGMPVDEPIPAGDMAFHRFFATHGQLGYYIPNFIDVYISQHGGYEFSGPPVTHFKEVADGQWEQCFYSYCLNYYEYALEGVQIIPVPLGQAYHQLYNPGLVPTATPTLTQPEAVTLEVWEASEEVTSLQTQTIYVRVTRSEAAQEGEILILHVMVPGLPTQSYVMAALDSLGESSVVIPPIVIGNGTAIEYEVCLQMPLGYEVCEGDHFVIWGN